VTIRCLVLIPGLVWLLLPPVCICQLPTRALDTISHGAPLFPIPGDSKDTDHAPWCPVLKKFNPTSVTPVVEAPTSFDSLECLPLAATAAVAPGMLRDASSFHAQAEAGSAGQLTYLIVRALRI
jgi:hypothetical protein